MVLNVDRAILRPTQRTKDTMKTDTNTNIAIVRPLLRRGSAVATRPVGSTLADDISGTSPAAAVSQGLRWGQKPCSPCWVVNAAQRQVHLPHRSCHGALMAGVIW